MPEELHPQALRLSAASGHRDQIRDVVGTASAGELRRLVIELLSPDVDPCLRVSRRSCYQLLVASASASAITRSAAPEDMP